MKNVIVTVDTEGHEGIDPVQHLIWGETKEGERGGIPLIIDLCDKYGAKALFFVDFAQAWDYGKEKIRNIVSYIRQHGHDVGVHIHPDHMADPKRKFLSQYSREEQYSIIKQCTDLYIELLGVPPKAFRAGKYGANRDTLQILDELGYKADFSQFYGQKKWCHIQPPITGARTVKITDSLIEVPVISYKNQFPLLFNRYDKWDINSTRLEHTYVFKKMICCEYIENCSLFVHSFSMLNWRQNVNSPTINKKIVRDFEFALQMVNNTEKTQFVSLDYILEGQYPSMDSSHCDVPSISNFPSLVFFFFKGLSVLHNRWLSFRYGKEL